MFFGVVFLVVVVFSLYLLFAAEDYTVTETTMTNSSNITSTNVTDGGNYLLNISLNASISGGGGVPNITEINIVLPDALTLTNSINYTNISIAGATNNYTFKNITIGGVTILNWSNYSDDGSAGTIYNATKNITFVFNVTAEKPGNYNITVIINNGSALHHRNITIKINDTVGPLIQEENFTMQSSYGNYSGTLILNVSIFDDEGNDDFNGTVYFNITNQSNDRFPVTNLSINMSRAGTNSTYWNATIDTSTFPDGAYNITVIANDSNTNINNTGHIYQVVFDNTGPTVTLSSTTLNKNDVTLAISASDATTGVNGSCTVDRPDAVVSGSSSLTESSLNCGYTYSYVVTCTDLAGTAGSSSATAFTTASCDGSGSSGGGGGGSSTTWAHTYVIADVEFEEGYTKELSPKNRVKVNVNNEEHYVGVKDITATSATVEIASTPVSINLEIGEDAKADVDEDGFYDIYVKLNGIVNGKADLTIQSINEEIIEVDTDDGVTTTGEIIPEDELSEEGEGVPVLVWIIIGIVIVLALIGGGIAAKKRK